MGRAWRETYDEDVRRLRAKIAGHTREIEELGKKFDIYNPKRDRERLSIYLVHAHASLEVVTDAFAEFEQEWDLQVTKGGLRRGVLGEWTDQP